ncbi:hypothetical protein ZWY2020_027595 [Hordeum vulgare]|nr:hypothetical protein ZWY2020_027595 [Hordeum vulgare]
MGGQRRLVAWQSDGSRRRPPSAEKLTAGLTMAAMALKATHQIGEVQSQHPLYCLHKHTGTLRGIKRQELEAMSWWKSKSHLNADSQDSSSDDVYRGGKERSPSRRKKSDEDEEEYRPYAGYGANTNRGGANEGGGGYNGGYGGGAGGYNNGYSGGGPYGNGNGGITPYNGGGGGYNSNSSYGNGAGGYSNGGDGYNNAPSWASQDAAGRTPMYINTREVHVYGAPQNDDDYYNGDQKRRGGGGGGGGGGFFGPAFHAVGHFVDRRFGLDDRN